ncbi:ABC transporter permease [Allokutzneria sp. A3M-2-11 16]|uniref:ABC transporter permease n=1 Tax=Allokutzneria sp. A3M-2-11 16 TaxID=2962043 RepID=UPI0020B70832|nr:ABC transporter permease [Allokutzneria sp. A3M-2-11 16]MCP3802992.1 ABC transporter permease [Allokutzneria sp. A3M-2-11 16]
MIRPPWTRLLWVEYRCGAGIVLTPVAAVISWLDIFGADAEWPGPWLTLAERTRGTLVFLAPLVAAVAAWQASRERRRDVRGLLASTPRDRLHRTGLSWASIALASALGLLVPLLAGAVLVAWHGGYGGSGWWWLILNTFLALGLVAAFGTVVGTLVPRPVLAVATGAVAYFLWAVLVETGVPQLSLLLPYVPPRLPWEPVDVRGGPQVLAALWFIAVTVALLALVSVRPKRWAAVPAAGAVAIAVVFCGFASADFWAPDQRALELVCRDRVCTTRDDAHLLDKINAMAKPLLDKVSGIPGAPTSAMPEDSGRYLRVYGMVISWRGEPMRGALHYRDHMVAPVLSGQCAEAVTRALRVQRVAALMWWTGDHSTLDWEPRAADLVERLNRLDVAAQRRWFAQYLDAVRRCDSSAVAAIP